MFEDLRQDLGHSFRMFVKTPAFTLAAVAALTLGIGANMHPFLHTKLKDLADKFEIPWFMEFERNLKMLDVVTKFESIRVADDIDLDARQVEADVVVAPVEEERPRPEFGERGERGEEPFDPVADDRGED